MARVVRPGGKLYMANWTPNSRPAQMFKCVSSYNPPHPGFIPPVLWGDEETVLNRLERDFTDIRLSRKYYPQWQYPFAAKDLVSLFRKYFGPVKAAFDKSDRETQQQLFDELSDIYQRNSNYFNEVLTITNGEYLEVIATRR